ncbi:MAG: response regulator [Sporolactobacillus sp.]
MTNILIVDDHLMMLLGLKELLEKVTEFHIVATLSNTKEIEQYIRSQQIDVLILDVRLKNQSGISVAKQMRKLFPQLKIIILSGYDYNEYSEAAETAGADAFVSKEESNEELASIIKDVVKGRKIFLKHTVPKSNQNLTARELEVLKLISKDMTTAEISASLLISKRTVEYHIATILQKLDADSRVGAVVTGIRLGLLDI